MDINIRKWGNSLAVRIPAALAAELSLADGSEANIRIDDGCLKITPKQSRYTLEELLAGMTEDNQPGEVDWGPEVGAEFIEDDGA